ncbi:MAG: hypothetical protein WD266_01375 [Balneolales bacterium]
MMKKLSALTFAFIILTGCGDTMPWYDKDNSVLAYLAIEDYVNEHLAAPSTAEYPSLSEKKSHTTRESDNIYVFKSWVDAENVYGAMVRRDFVARIQQIGENEFNLISIEVEE